MRWIWYLIIVAVGWILGDRIGLPAGVQDFVDAQLQKVPGVEARADEAEGSTPVEDKADPEVIPPAKEANSSPEVPTGSAVGASGGFNARSAAASLAICGGMTVAHAPSTDGNLNVVNAPARVSLKGVPVALMIAPGACLSSGYGSRNGRLHKGIDYHHEPGVSVYAGAAGTILEAKYRDDYGNMVVIDHGNGAYTRYAHLARFGSGIIAGASVSEGTRLGQMGNTASYSIPIHVHYEMLTGDYDTPKKSFGLKSVDPFGLPRAN